MRKHSRSWNDTTAVRLNKLLAQGMCAAIAGLLAVPVSATVVAASWFQADNVAISLDPGAGTISFAPTSLLFMQQLGASALDSFGNSAGQSVTLPPDAATSASAAIATAAGNSAITLSPPSASPLSSLSLRASSSAMSAGSSAASASAFAQWSTAFMVTPDAGADPAITGTRITLSMLASGFLSGAADAFGNFDTEGAVIIDITGDPNGPTLFYFPSPLAGGPDFPATLQQFAETVMNTFDVSYGATYDLTIFVDSETNTRRTPEPATVFLVAIGVVLLTRRRTT